MPQGVDLKKWALDLARQYHALLEVSVRVLGSIRPELGDAEADQGQRAQVLANSNRRRVRRRVWCEQPLRLLYYSWKVAALTCEGQPEQGKGDLEPAASFLGHRRRASGCQREMEFRIFNQTMPELVSCGQRGELWIACDCACGESGEELLCRCALSVEFEAEPVVGEQMSRKAPALGRLGVADRLNRIPMLRMPLGRRCVQRDQLVGFAAPQLELQQVREQAVVAKPRAPRIQRDHKRVGLLEILQDPLPAGASCQDVGERATDSLEHGSSEQQPPHVLWLALEHLGKQVVGDSALGTGKLRCEPFRVGMARQRKRGKSQSRDPALCPLYQQRQPGLRQHHPGPFNQEPCLMCGEAEIGCPDLGKLTLEAHTMQSQAQVVAGGEHEP